MSQSRPNNEYKRPYLNPGSKPRFKRQNERGRYFYQPRYDYFNSPFGVQPWGLFRWRRPPFKKKPKTPEKERPRSPFSGTEEYTLKKIQETSDMIKKRLMMPEIADVEMQKTESTVPVAQNSESVGVNTGDKCDSEKLAVKDKKPAKFNVEEIHHKIITHITNLNHGKKMNLICATSSGYDEAIQQIQKQKRLELSKALRDMCSNHTLENSEVINSIIPDIGIKIEDLPLEVIKELSSTLHLNFEDTSLKDNEGTVKIKTEVCEGDEFVSNYLNASDIKTENNSDEVHNNDYSMDCADGVDNLNFLHNETDTMQIFSSPTKDTHSEESQTEVMNCQSLATQTDLNISNEFSVNPNAETLKEAVQSMLEIDKEIERLTKIRQSIFLQLQNKNTKKKVLHTQTNTDIKSVNNFKSMKVQPSKKIYKKKVVDTQANTAINNVNDFKTIKVHKNEDFYETQVDFGDISEKILVMKVVKDTLLAGSESGRLFYINLKDGITQIVINVGDLPITSVCVWETVKKRSHICVGSLAKQIKEYDFNKSHSTRIIHTREGVQCMESSWGFIFIGTVNGTLLRYSLQLSKIEFEEKISEDSILVLKATQEGARRVLLIGTRNSPVCVRDAMSALHMRTMDGIIAPTVYSLILEKSLIYCGTTFHDILVYGFHEGNLVRKYSASNSKGVGCMKIVEDLLFASCFNGNIYVYNTKTRLYVGQIEGPGGVILSMEVFKNIIIIGTMSCKFKSLLIPEYILQSNNSGSEV